MDLSAGICMTMMEGVEAEPPVNPEFANTVLLMSFDGADGATAMSDESEADRGAAVVMGNAQLDTAQKKFGTSSLLLDGNGDFLRFADSEFFNFGAGDFTIEAFVRFSNLSGFKTIVAQSSEFGDAWLLDFPGSSNNLLRLVLTSDGNVDSFIQRAWAPSINTWYHVCAERSGNSVRLYADGVKLGSTSTYSNTLANTDRELRIGSLHNTTGAGGNYFSGWIDELRISKGVARYASDSGFTPPAAPFPRS